jgi:hypothetical protein
MSLYIETENGQAKNHPAFEYNLIQAFGSVPEHWETFIRVEKPSITLYQTFESDEPVYTKVNGVWTDVWTVRDMTAEEKAAKQQAVRDTFNSFEQASNWSTWTLDETTCTMEPPIPRLSPNPTKLAAGIMTFWCGAENNWKDTPAKPTDNKQYKFDFFAWQWVEITQG